MKVSIRAGGTGLSCLQTHLSRLPERRRLSSALLSPSPASALSRQKQPQRWIRLHMWSERKWEASWRVRSKALWVGRTRAVTRRKQQQQEEGGGSHFLEATRRKISEEEMKEREESSPICLAKETTTKGAGRNQASQASSVNRRELVLLEGAMEECVNIHLLESMQEQVEELVDQSCTTICSMWLQRCLEGMKLTKTFNHILASESS